jgi:hypothetical protein
MYEKKQCIIKYCVFVFIFCLLLVLVNRCLASQIIDVGGADVDVEVAGNGDINNNGQKPFNKDPNNNTIRIFNVLVSNVHGARVNGGTVSGNRVEVSDGGTVSGDVKGGRTNVGEARENRVEVIGGIVLEDVHGGFTSNGDAIGNVVKIKSGRIVKGVIGGYSENGDAIKNRIEVTDGIIGKGGIFGGCSENGNAIGNIVKITGGIIGREQNNNICGGISCKNGNATGNTVDISGDVKIYKGFNVCGGLSYGANKDSFTDNTLNLEVPIEVHSVINFQNYNFLFPSNIKNGDTMITAAAGGIDNRPIDLSNTNIKINTMRKCPEEFLNVGDKIVLIHSNAGFVNEPNNNHVIVDQCILYKHRFNLIQIGKDLIAELVSKAEDIENLIIYRYDKHGEL